jgi:hypothetical protein
MEGFEVQENISPDWLRNPATNRRLKLDLLYDQVGLGVRFVGLAAKGQRRQSDWEHLEEDQRNQTRSELCRQNGVELFLLDLYNADPRRQLRELRRTLSRLSRTLAQSSRPDADKLSFMPMLAEARSRLEQIAARVRRPDDLAVFAELWRDREVAAVADARASVVESAAKPARLGQLQVGQQVLHHRYGAGTVSAVQGNAADPQITIHFEDQSERTFLASLAAGKLHAI